MTQKYLVDTTTSSQGWPDMEAMRAAYKKVPYDQDQEYQKLDLKNPPPKRQSVKNKYQSVVRKDIRDKEKAEAHRRHKALFVGAAVVALVVALAASQGKDKGEVQAAADMAKKPTPIEQVVANLPEDEDIAAVGLEPIAPAETVSHINLELPEAAKAKIEVQAPIIEQLKPLYVQAAEATGLPWQAAAALHFREADNREDRSMLSGEKLGTVNPDSHQIAPTEKVENYIKALEHLKMMVKAVYGIELTVQSSLEDFAKAAETFNRGYKYQRANMTYLDLPYVMNGLSGYEDMRWPTTGGSYEDGNTYGETSSLRGKIESRPGFIAVMLALGYQFNE